MEVPFLSYPGGMIILGTMGCQLLEPHLLDPGGLHSYDRSLLVLLNNAGSTSGCGTMGMIMRVMMM